MVTAPSPKPVMVAAGRQTGGFIPAGGRLNKHNFMI